MKSPPFLYLFSRVCQGKSGKRGVKINVSDLRKQASGFSDGYFLLYETAEKKFRENRLPSKKKGVPKSGKRMIGKKKKAALLAPPFFEK